jgi:hypothetical protein
MGIKTARIVAAVLLLADCSSPTPLTATVDALATKTASVGGQTQLVVTVTNTGPLIPHLGLVFMTADKWYDHNLITDAGKCSTAADHAGFDCGDLAAGQKAVYSIAGTAKDAGNFHYEMALQELVSPYKFVNDHPNGADVQAWDETVTSS